MFTLITRKRIGIALLSVVVVLSVSAQVVGTVVFRHVNVIPMDHEGVLRDRTVVVRNGRIAAVKPAASDDVPGGAVDIDASGKYIMPSLSDMHVHLESDAWNIMFPADRKFTAEEIRLEDILFVYMAHGITTIDVLFAHPEHLAIRERIRRNEVAGPRLVLSRMIDGAGRAWPPPLGVWINGASEARTAVTEAFAQGYDRIKVYSFLDKASYDSIIVTGRELKMPVDGHIPFSVSPEYVAGSGQQMIAHVEEIAKFAKGYTQAQVHEFASLFAKHGMWITTTLILDRNLNTLLKDSAGQFTKTGTDLLHPMARGIWNFVYQKRYRDIPGPGRKDLADAYEHFDKPFVREFASLGGKLLTGTDSPIPSTIPGISLHEELEELVHAGLRPYEALRVSAVNAHNFLGDSDQFGTISDGKRADFILLDGDPLQDIRNTRRIAGVMTNGRWFPHALIEKRMDEIRRSYSRLAETKGMK